MDLEKFQQLYCSYSVNQRSVSCWSTIFSHHFWKWVSLISWRHFHICFNLIATRCLAEPGKNLQQSFSGWQDQWMNGIPRKSPRKVSPVSASAWQWATCTRRSVTPCVFTDIFIKYLAVNPPVVHHSYLSIKGRQGLWCSWCDVRLTEMLDNVMRVSQQSQGLQHTLIVLSSAQWLPSDWLVSDITVLWLVGPWMVSVVMSQAVFGSHVWLHCQVWYMCIYAGSLMDQSAQWEDSIRPVLTNQRPGLLVW